MLIFISLLITFLSCCIGTVCGMGGGIIIKPALDATGMMSVATITFLSGVTVIAMTSWTVFKTLRRGESVIELKNTTILAVGAALGGILGKQLFRMVAAQFEDPNTAGGIQAALLFAATLATFVYTIRKDRLKTKQVELWPVILLIGFVLGVLGAFLGIGGGPFNVAMLCYFFSMPTKKATQNSLYIVLFSQIASTVNTLVSSGIPEFPVWMLVGMIVCGIAGSTMGRIINKKIDDRQATWFFEGAMLLIMAINIFNIFKFL